MTTRIKSGRNTMAANRDQGGIDRHWEALIGIEKHWEVLINIDRHWSTLIFIDRHCDQYIKFDPALIGIDQHRSLKQHVLLCAGDSMQQRWYWKVLVQWMNEDFLMQLLEQGFSRLIQWFLIGNVMNIKLLNGFVGMLHNETWNMYSTNIQKECTFLKLFYPEDPGQGQWPWTMINFDNAPPNGFQIKRLQPLRAALDCERSLITDKHTEICIPCVMVIFLSTCTRQAEPIYRPCRGPWIV